MKQHTFAALAAAILMLALIGSAVACIPECPCGNWKPKQFGWCGPHDECCRQIGFFYHQHGERVCPTVPVVVEETHESFTPFSVWGNDACADPMNGVVTVNVNRHDIPFVVLYGVYDSEFDTLEISTYHGEWLSDGFYNPVVACNRVYGGMPTLTVSNPQRAILLRAAKRSPTEDTLPMTVALKDNNGVILYEETTTTRTIDTTLILPK